MKKIIIKIFKAWHDFFEGMIASLESSSYENEVKKNNKNKK
jgi:hypothetical protein